MSPTKPGPLVLLDVSQLKHHPRNMRRFYPIQDVRQMAQSIAGAHGLVQPLIVVPNGERDCYYVVDGNMRLAGARFLGADCPLESRDRAPA